MALNYTLALNYILCFLMGFMLFVVPQRRYFISWIKTKLPFFTGDVQVRIKNPVNDYMAVGTYTKGILRYMGKPTSENKKPWRTLNIPMEAYSKAVYRCNGVPCIDVDDVKNCILVWNGASYEAVAGFNAEEMDKFMSTLASEPNPNAKGLNDQYFKWIVIGLGCVSAVMGYMILKKMGLLDGHIKMVYDLVQPIFLNMNLTYTPPPI